MVLRRDAVANLEDSIESGEWPRGLAPSIVGERPNLAGERSIHDIYPAPAGRRTQVRIDEGSQVISKTEEIAGGDHRITRHLSFNDQVALMNERVLKTFAEVIDARGSRRGRRQDVRKDWRCRVAGY